MPGILLNKHTGTTLKVAGYADDTSVYLRSKDELPVLDDILLRFTKASGLQVNKTKTAVINLRPDGSGSKHGYQQ
ncbi:TPA: hypothetical protein N0F65_007475 [Lagenidium giganteum]|uniref:Reverse transcriptase domain-containing protein n=1 Tax=Lagenidium giganteum TaxID=4803 RepID=A0AAV2ZN65_9STRA|nr:TPA: hypothetical protein N0F65_007475 [Lagenidium giganteum]